MTRRTAISLAALLAGGLLAGTTAFAFGGHRGHFGRDGMMKRFVASAIDDVLDEAKVTDEQRNTIYAARDRVFAAVEAQRGSRRDHLEKALALFEADRVDQHQISALHQEAEAGRQKTAEVIHQALVEVHDVLTPEQRKVVADYVRDFRGWRH